MITIYIKDGKIVDVQDDSNQLTPMVEGIDYQIIKLKEEEKWETE